MKKGSLNWCFNFRLENCLFIRCNGKIVRICITGLYSITIGFVTFETGPYLHQNCTEYSILLANMKSDRNFEDLWLWGELEIKLNFLHIFFSVGEATGRAGCFVTWKSWGIKPKNFKRKFFFSGSWSKPWESSQRIAHCIQTTCAHFSLVADRMPVLYWNYAVITFHRTEITNSLQMGHDRAFLSVSFKSLRSWRSFSISAWFWVWNLKI